SGRYQNQSPIRVLTELAIVTGQSAYVDEARSRLSNIPPAASEARADALLWIALAATKTAKDEQQFAQSLSQVDGFDPAHRIVFHLRFMGLASIRFYFKA
ncbi:MAG: hypothetical protein SFV22_15860, partial [Saprospiraceae bacterium]|nr:hypothetical protein [Saprospiraceae bacterium]